MQSHFLTLLFAASGLLVLDPSVAGVLLLDSFACRVPGIRVRLPRAGDPDRHVIICRCSA